MTKYLFVYHGGGAPGSEAEMKQVMDAWGAWFGTLGAAVVEPGNPVGVSKTVNSDGSVANDGGANPASGFSVIEASSHDDAVSKAKGCPILAAGGSVEVAEVMAM